MYNLPSQQQMIISSIYPYFEYGKVSKVFCGASCLKQWIETELDKTHLSELENLK